LPAAPTPGTAKTFLARPIPMAIMAVISPFKRVDEKEVSAQTNWHSSYVGARSLTSPSWHLDALNRKSHDARPARDGEESCSFAGNPPAPLPGPMKIVKPVRATRSYTQRLVADPTAVFPLLCPVREADWIEGWDPPWVASSSGFAEPDCVFITSAEPVDAVWYITRHEPATGFVEMLKITPGVTACRLTIQLRPAPGGSEAAITYSHTSLGPDGDAFVALFTEEFYRKFMQDWESRINYYLRHGTALKAAPG